MKKIVLLCLVALMGAGVCVAQKSAKKKEVTTVFTADIDCEHCAKKILDNVPSLGKGIKDVQVDVASKQVTVTYDPAKNSDENIVKGLASLKVNAAPAAAAGKACCGKCGNHGKDAACTGECKEHKGCCGDKKEGACCGKCDKHGKDAACTGECKEHKGCCGDKKEGACCGKCDKHGKDAACTGECKGHGKKGGCCEKK